jgi:hypothetical protein
VVDQHVLVFIFSRLLESVGWLAEQVAVQCLRDELKDTQDVDFTLCGPPFAVEEEL